MKRQRILKTLVLLAGMAVIPGSLMAQSTLTARGVVKGAFKEEGKQNLEFGEMDGLTGAASDRVIDLLDTGSDLINGNAGYIDFKLNKTGTNFSFSLPASLSNGGSSTLAVDSWECGLEVGDSPNSVTDPGSQAGLDEYSGDCSAALVADLSSHDGARLVRLYVGGTILATEFQDAVADTYTETINITIAGF